MKAANRRCRNCRKKVPAESAFVSQLRAFCSYDCLITFTKSDKGAQVVEKQRKSQDRAAKEKLKTRSDYNREAQAAFNAYIRYRDRKQNCISCNTTLSSQSIGGGYDAGHMLSRGAHPSKRFWQSNCHGQCKKCNRWLSGNVEKFRVGVVWRYGQEYLDRVECHHENPPEFDIEYLKRVRDVFRKKLRHKKKLHKKMQ